MEQINPDRIKEAGKSFLISFLLGGLWAGILVYLSYNAAPKSKEDFASLLLKQQITSGICGVLVAGVFINGCIELMRCTKKHKA
jgi:hypothetical protein